MAGKFFPLRRAGRVRVRIALDCEHEPMHWPNTTMFENELVMATPRSLTSSSKATMNACFLAGGATNHASFCVARHDDVMDVWMTDESFFQDRHTLRAVAGAGERNPEVALAWDQPFFHVGEETSAGNGKDFTFPKPTEDVDETSAHVVGSARADEKDSWVRPCRSPKSRLR